MFQLWTLQAVGNNIPTHPESRQSTVIGSKSEGERATAPNMDTKELERLLFADDQTKWLSTSNTNVSAVYFNYFSSSSFLTN